MEDLEYYTLVDETLEEACKNARNNEADIGRLNTVCIETGKRLRKAKEEE